MLAGAAGLLTEKGCLSVVLPADGADAFTGQAARYGLFPARTLAVCPVPGTVPKRMLIEFRPFRGGVEAEVLAIAPEGGTGYTYRYRALTGDFYLKM